MSYQFLNESLHSTIVFRDVSDLRIPCIQPNVTASLTPALFNQHMAFLLHG